MSYSTWDSVVNCICYQMIVSSPSLFSPGFKRILQKGLVKCLCLFFSEKSPTLMSVNWFLILSQEAIIGNDSGVTFLATDYSAFGKFSSLWHL